MLETGFDDEIHDSDLSPRLDDRAFKTESSHGLVWLTLPEEESGCSTVCCDDGLQFNPRWKWPSQHVQKWVLDRLKESVVGTSIIISCVATIARHVAAVNFFLPFLIAMDFPHHVFFFFWKLIYLL